MPEQSFQEGAVPAAPIAEQIQTQIKTAEVAVPTETQRHTATESLVVDEEPQEDYAKLAALEEYIPPALRDLIYETKGKIEGERKLVTTIFSDVTGFTALSEKFADEPEEIHRIINECLKRQIDEVYKLEGIPDKVVGDELMALFGAPITHENDAERAIQAAIAMREAVKRYGDERGIKLDVHIGINTGKVSVGSIGGQKLLNYTVIGDPVNLASRIEHIAQAGEIVVGELTYKLTKGLFDFEPPRYVEVKNKTGTQPIYKLIGHKEHPENMRGIEGLDSQMVGREIEFETLMASARKAMAREFQIVSIVGEAGLGKSRLKRELKKELGNEVTWIEGYCQSHTEHAAYSVFLNAIKSRFGLSGLDTEKEIKDKITSGIMELFGEDAELSAEEEILPYILYLMNVKLSDKQAEKIKYLQEEPEELKKQTFAAIKHILTQEAKQRTLVLALEDLHWLDEISYELILFLMDNLTETPTLLLNVYRPERYAEGDDRLCWRIGATAREKFSDDRYAEVHIERLSREDMELILNSLLNLEDTQDSRDLKNMILDKAEGNPFYLEEVIRTLIEDVVIQPEEGGNGYVLVGDMEDIDVPVGVEAIVRARIDRIKGDQKQTLQHSSVIGRIFPHRILEYISPSEINLDKNLEQLIDLEILMHNLKNSSELEYNFRHILTYQIVYDSIIARRKRELHGLVGDCLEKYYPEEVFLDDIVYHYRHSDKTDKAVSYLLKAGRRAQQLYSKSDAIDYYSEALKRMQDIPEDTSEMQMMAHEGLGDIYRIDGQFDVALDNYSKALKHYKIPESKASILRRMGEIYQKKGEYATALEKYTAGLAELDEKAKSPESVRISTDIGFIHYIEGRYPEAVKMYTQALEKIKGTENYYIEALIYNKLGIVMSEQGNFDSAIEYWDKSREIFEKFNAGVELANLYNNLGDLHIKRGDSKKAIFYFQLSLKEKEKLGDVDGLILLYSNYGKLYNMRGDFDKALEFYQKGLGIAERIGSKRRIGIINNNLASMYLRHEEYEKAIEHLQKCLPIFENLNLTMPLSICFTNIGYAYCELGKPDEALEYHDKALEIGKQLEDPHLFSGVYNNIGRVCLKKRDYDEAINYNQKVLEMVTEEKYPQTLGDAYRDLGEAYLGKGNPQKARMYLHKAAEIFEKLENASELGKVKEIIRSAMREV